MLSPEVEIIYAMPTFFFLFAFHCIPLVLPMGALDFQPIPGEVLVRSASRLGYLDLGVNAKRLNWCLGAGREYRIDIHIEIIYL